jgi:hypothetical protein
MLCAMPRSNYLFALVAAALMGCESTKGTYETKTAPSYEKKLERVMLLPPDTEMRAYLGAGFYERFGQRLKESLAKKDVPCEALQSIDDKLDDSARHEVARAAWQRFRATQVLEVLAARRGKTMFDMRFVLQDAATGKVVWGTKGVFYGAPKPEQIADEVVQELAASHLL